MATQYKPNPTRAELREEAKKETVAPPRGTTKKEADIFREGMKPPKDDEGPVKPVSAEEQKRYTQRLKTLREREMKQRGITGKQFADEANKDIDSGELKKGGSVKSASARADGCAVRGKTRA